MRNLIINTQTLYVLNYLGEVEVVDSLGNKTGETTNAFTKPIQFCASVSGARGNSQTEVFGNEINYDKTILLSKSLFKQLRIEETSVFFVDRKVEYDKNNFPKYDYKVERIAETINEVVIAISKVRAY